MKFYITDVFGFEKYTGNQLATFLDCGHLSDAEKQQIAREINFSETTFVMSDRPRDGAYDVRIFTPREEIPFAGHPTLGTAFIIQRHVIGQPVSEVILNFKVGQVPVRFPEAGGDSLLWMRQREPEFGPTFDSRLVAPVLQIGPADLDARWPVEEVSTGLPHIIVPLASFETLQRVVVDVERYSKLIAQNGWAKSILVFCPTPDSDDHDLRVRVFGHYYGVPEDPATGSGNGCLAAYLVRHRFGGSSSINLRSGQGYEIGRPSLLALRATEDRGHYTIEVGGQVIPVAQGEWL